MKLKNMYVIPCSSDIVQPFISIRSDGLSKTTYSSPSANVLSEGITTLAIITLGYGGDVGVGLATRVTEGIGVTRVDWVGVVIGMTTLVAEGVDVPTIY